ncbi:MAG: MotA/TolQ/ExbB proton channel family protein [Deltaproteobacteria bacterium]|jgi:biopolymer transport protein ExbB|nr:MotA/TolQ/ExbB proton channel family protein [Deltaproteobacteria bacterium]MBT6432318.1 MotA/TolQ/ExbB proton channel family protein [Deltaproteobacteria bacterium]MBT6492882.1 MotA/TolQ/ExbB proton channel family protein [Deltaproteobacteria bacterium]
MLAGAAKFFVDGGAFMWPIAITSVFGVAIMVERVIFLFFKYNINANQFMAQIQKLVMANNIDRAIKLCNAAPSAALPKVIKAGLTRANKGEIEIANAIEEASLEVIPNITKRTPTLQAVSNVATMLGLLGTIMGLIEAFDAVAKAPPDQKTTMLTAAIAIAMNTTAFGLIVAIPTIAAYVFLNNTVKKIIDEIDQYSVKLQNLLVSRGKGAQSPLDR